MERDAAGVTIEIADVPILLELDRSLAQEVRKRYGSFLSTRRPQLSFHLQVQQREPPSNEVEVEVNVDAAQGNDVYRLNRWDFDCTMDLDAGEVSGWVGSGPISVDVLLRVAMSLVLARDRGFLLHAAGVLRGGRSILFYGVSGSGKSTIAETARDATLLSEEIVAVRRKGNEVIAYGTPFSGQLQLPGTAACGPVAALLSLVGAPNPTLERIGPSVAARGLLRSVLYFGGTIGDTDGILETCVTVANEVPCFKFRMDLESPLWEQLNGLG